MMGTGECDGEDRARIAAEAAVNSPLLDDIDLSGANGILVNVTAGMDLSIGEFDTVGRTVKEFAAKDATVVLGTVIDPDMNGSMRVTVVATGLGKSATVRQTPDVRVVRPTATERPDYGTLEAPAVNRTKRAVGDGLTGLPQDGLLDIPAFLRRQAD
jgi:cell division protein FtsZ